MIQKVLGMKPEAIANFVAVVLLTGSGSVPGNAQQPTAAQRKAVNALAHKWALEDRAKAKSSHLPTSQRKKIYFELGLIEERVNRETQNVSPEQYGAMSDALTDKYRRRLAKKYHITQRQVEAIENEGAMDKWNTPAGPASR